MFPAFNFEIIIRGVPVRGGLLETTEQSKRLIPDNCFVILGRDLMYRWPETDAQLRRCMAKICCDRSAKEFINGGIEPVNG